MTTKHEQYMEVLRRQEQNLPQPVDFSADVFDLAQSMTNKVVVAAGDPNRRVKLDTVLPWPHAVTHEMTTAGLRPIKPRYRDVLLSPEIGIREGMVWTPPQRSIRQIIIPSHEEGRPGACVSITSVSVYNPETGVYVPDAREGTMANYFDLPSHSLSELVHTMDANILQLVRTEEIVDPTQRVREQINAADRTQMKFDALIRGEI